MAARGKSYACAKAWVHTYMNDTVPGGDLPPPPRRLFMHPLVPKNLSIAATSAATTREDSPANTKCIKRQLW